MNHLLRSVLIFLKTFGLDLRRTISSLKGIPLYLRDLQTFKRQRATDSNPFPLGKLYPCLGDRFEESGSAQGHYFHQDLLIAQRIHINNPHKHVDVGSRLDGFVAHVASFRLIEVFDIRPQSNRISNIKFTQADLMAPMKDELIDYCDSLSCLHALEHFGLGRYGDPIYYNGYLLGLENLQAILKQGGKFYFSVPIGQQRIEFNAHRVFSVKFLLDYFAAKYNVDQFSFVDDEGNLNENVPLTDTEVKKNFGCAYGCGIFEMTKN